MIPQSKCFARGYWAVTAGLLLAATVLLLTWTPVEQTMGPIQKIFYIHVPIAACALLACLVTFIASVAYLWKRSSRWDDLGAGAGLIAVVLTTGVLVTGMIWSRGAWGKWWTWNSPKLVFSLLLWLLYVVYGVVRLSIESPSQRAIVAAVYGVIAFLDVPLVWLSSRLMPDIHPASVTLAPEMKLTLMVWFVPVMLLSAGLIVWADRAARRGRSARRRAAAPAEPMPAISGQLD